MPWLSEALMFPILEIEAFYAQYMKGQMDIDGYQEVAALTEQWLLGFEEARDPAMSAIQNLCLQGANDYDKRMLMALSLVMCVPSGQTSRILLSYGRHIDREMGSVQPWVSAMTMALQSHDVCVDVMKALAGLDKQTFEVACSAYDITSLDVAIDAVAWDDLELFHQALDGDVETGRYWAFTALAKFDPDVDSRIYRAVVQTDEDKKEFFFARTQHVRARLFDQFADPSTYARPSGPRYATLFPDGVSALQMGSCTNNQAFYQQPDFKEQLMKDAERVIKSFFQHLNVGVGDEQNDQHAITITQAFLDAGICAEYLIEHGPCAPLMVKAYFDPGISAGKPTEQGYMASSDVRAPDNEDDPMSLQKALRRYSEMKPAGQVFFNHLYSAYLVNFTTEQIIDNCKTPESLAGAYRITRDKRILESGNDHTRTMVMGQDLGL